MVTRTAKTKTSKVGANTSRLQYPSERKTRFLFRSKASEKLLNFVKKIPKYFTDGPLPETRIIDILILLLAGIVRNTAGFAWGYSQKGNDLKWRFLIGRLSAIKIPWKAWFEETTDDDSYLLYLTLGPVTSGIIGCTLGGIVTDYLRRVDWMNSVQAALLVETVAHVIATPIMKPNKPMQNYTNQNSVDLQSVIRFSLFVSLQAIFHQLLCQY